MFNDLIRLANHLDAKGLTKEADFIDRLLKKSNKTSKAIDYVCGISKKMQNRKDRIKSEDISVEKFEKKNHFGDNLVCCGIKCSNATCFKSLKALVQGEHLKDLGHILGEECGQKFKTGHTIDEANMMVFFQKNKSF
jgi:mannitol/fructose-specific phosphotransferase system IIA component